MSLHLSSRQSQPLLTSAQVITVVSAYLASSNMGETPLEQPAVSFMHRMY